MNTIRLSRIQNIESFLDIKKRAKKLPGTVKNKTTRYAAPEAMPENFITSIKRVTTITRNEIVAVLAKITARKNHPKVER
mmetsp:Transcript_3276/g.4769  ORF Transcript_3276/g.4769 Transcript_3276/m.4769 type:complete len:80 (-) Transcript_3276:1014-1253(-)